jgi:pectinesterase
MPKGSASRLKRALALGVFCALALGSCHARSTGPFSRARVLEQVRAKYPNATLPPDVLPPGVTAHEDVVYAEPSGVRLALDLYSPSAAAPLPAVIVVHGGGWESGERQMERPFAKRLAALGYVAAPVSYRLGPAGRFPNALYDLKAAVRFLRANATKFGIDPGRVGAVGGSAGGQLVALLGASNGVQRLAGDGADARTSRVQAVVDIDGLASFSGPDLLAKEFHTPGGPTRFLGGSFNSRASTWHEASALSHVSAESAPTLFIDSTAPTPILPGRPEMRDALRAHGVASELVVLPDTPHPFWLVEPWFSRTLQETARFFAEHLRK